MESSLIRILHGDCRDVLPTLPAGSVQCCVTSPPYYGLRDYGVAGQIGLEPTPNEYVAQMVAVFREVRRVLADDGTCWLNLGDSYAGPNNGYSGDDRPSNANSKARSNNGTRQCGQVRKMGPGLKTKDLIGIPWRVAFALQDDGWYLRSDIIWHKPNPMPESVTDRPTSAHEHVFLLTKRERYFYDAGAIREADSGQDHRRGVVEAIDTSGGYLSSHTGIRTAEGRNGQGRNCRNVWTISPKPFSGAHFATMPPELAERCIRAGSRPGDTILDPFGGAATTGMAAERLGRHAIMTELNADYIAIARARVDAAHPILSGVL